MKILNIKKMLAVVVALIMPLSLISCGGNSEGNDVDLSKVKPNTDKPTDKLVVYCNSITKDILSTAITANSKKYPDVKVDLRDFGEDFFKYRETLRTEMAAGKGPDLLFGFGPEFDDIYKTMDTGAFCDLNTFFVGDKEYNPDLYIKEVFDCGVYNNHRYVVPFSYRTDSLVTTQKALEQEGIKKENLSSFKDFSLQIKNYINKYANDESKTVFDRQQLGLFSYMPWAGMKYINYNDKEINVDTDEFKMVMDAYKDLYQQDIVKGKVDTWTSTGDEVKAQISGNTLFIRHNYSGIRNLFFDYAALLHDQKPVFLKFPTFDGKTFAEPAWYAGIISSSQNKVNGYNLLKILLSQEVQASERNLEIPVLKSAITSKIKYEIEHRNGGLRDGSVTTVELPKEKVQEFEKYFTNIDSCEFVSYGSLGIIFEMMGPYFKGEVAYEKCLKNAKDKLEIYITE